MRHWLTGTAIAIALGLMTVWNPAAGQEPETATNCPPPTGLGELSDILTASGTWSTGECDTSQFVSNRPGQLFTFSLAEEAEIRIDLSSASRDPMVYLQAADGRLIDADDDTGGGGNARIERSLPAGTYQIEASTVGWSGRESGAFELTLRIVTGCHEVVDLGVLEDTLSASAVWSHFGCESTFRPDRSSQRYRFQVREATRVQIDLTSDVADPYVYLLDDSDTLLESDDDGGVRYNSRIVRVLGAGVYTIEATNWGDRDLKNLQEAEYEVSVGPAGSRPADQARSHRRTGFASCSACRSRFTIGSATSAMLRCRRSTARSRCACVGPYIDDWRTAEIGSIDGDIERWGVGESYHTSESVAAFGSGTLAELQAVRRRVHLALRSDRCDARGDRDQ